MDREREGDKVWDIGRILTVMLSLEGRWKVDWEEGKWRDKNLGSKEESRCEGWSKSKEQDWTKTESWSKGRRSYSDSIKEKKPHAQASDQTNKKVNVTDAMYITK